MSHRREPLEQVQDVSIPKRKTVFLLDDLQPFLFLKEKGKGQALTPDFLFSMVIFLALLAFGSMLWVTTYSGNVSTENSQNLALKAAEISESLVRSQGIPTNWTNDTVSVIGLAKEDHLLSESKLLELEKMSYANIRSILGIGNVDVNITIHNLTGTIVKSYGIPISVSAETVVPIDRRAVLEYSSGKKEIVIVKVRLWK